jgi:hypothetical protein
MISKELLRSKIEQHCKKNKIDNFIKACIINYLYDKSKYQSQYIEEKALLNMIDKNIYNLSVNLIEVIQIKHKEEIYIEYNERAKTLSYCIASKYKGIQEKEFVVSELKAMIYKELEKISNLYLKRNEIFSNGFYLENIAKTRALVDIFSDLEAALYINLKPKYQLNLGNGYYILTRHQSDNSEVLGYAEIVKKLIGEKLYYYAVNNPKLYSQKLRETFTNEYGDMGLIESYLIAIKQESDIARKIQYHKQISKILYGYGQKANLQDIEIYLIKHKEE